MYYNKELINYYQNIEGKKINNNENSMTDGEDVIPK